MSDYEHYFLSQQFTLWHVLTAGLAGLFLGYIHSRFQAASALRTSPISPPGSSPTKNENPADLSGSDWEDDDEEIDPNQELKMNLLVRNDLRMGKGKIAAQCSHATLGCYQRALKMAPANILRWSRSGQTKVAVKVEDEETMLALEAQARAAGLVTYIVADAGRTQIAAGSLTVLAIGPAPKHVLNDLVGHLKLL
ncbi:hypothetical protein H4R33_002053 [Dimargaris cristalligena]|nr:hypothetical protein H4R33_002053 [Dimargaris cristalligena]